MGREIKQSTQSASGKKEHLCLKGRDHFPPQKKKLKLAAGLWFCQRWHGRDSGPPGWKAAWFFPSLNSSDVVGFSPLRPVQSFGRNTLLLQNLRGGFQGFLIPYFSLADDAKWGRGVCVCVIKSLIGQLCEVGRFQSYLELEKESDWDNVWGALV